MGKLEGVGAPAGPERLRRLAGLLEVALELDGPLRAAYLENLARQDAELCREVRAWLEPSGGARTPADGGSEATVAGGGPHVGVEEDRIGPYRIVGILGSGGMGHVFRAERVDGEVQQEVAIKVLGDGFEAPIAHQRFLSERQILSGLDHPNIARMLDAGTTPEGRSYLVMEVIQGEPIDRFCEERRLPVGERLRLLQKVCSAVEHAHQRLVVHRDLKPSNILVTPEGEPKLLDFGIAKLLDPASFPLPLDEKTRTALRPMTPHWASPEQLRGDPITTATDVYSLGLLLYKLLTGRLPHAPSASAAERIHQLVADDPLTRPSEAVVETSHDLGWPESERPAVARLLRGDLDNIVAMTLRPLPEERYASVAAVRQDLDRYFEGDPVQATRGSWRYRTGKLAARYRWPLALSAAVLISALLFAALTHLQSEQLAEQRDRALLAEENAVAAQKGTATEARRARATRDFLADLLDIADDQVRAGQSFRLEDLLTFGLAELKASDDLEPLVKIQLARMIGDSFWSLGDFGSGVDAFTFAIRVADDGGISVDGAIEEIVLRKAQVLQDAGLFREAFESLLVAEEISQAAPEKLTDLAFDITFGAVHSGDFELGWRVISEAVSGERNYVSNHDLQRSVLFAALGIAHNTGDLRTAGDLSRNLWKSLRHPEEWDEVPSGSVDLIGWYYLYIGELENALRLSKDLHEFMLREYHYHDSDLASVEIKLGLIEGLRGSYEEAMALFEESLKRSREKNRLDPGDLRAKYHLARCLVLRAGILERRSQLQSMKTDLEAALKILEDIQKKADIIYVRNTHVMALLMLDRTEEARPLLQELLDLGWRRPDLMELARRKGVLPEDLPQVEIDLSLPPKFQAHLDSLPDVPFPWEPGGQEVMEQLMARALASEGEVPSSPAAGGSGDEAAGR